MQLAKELLWMRAGAHLDDLTAVEERKALAELGRNCCRGQPLGPWFSLDSLVVMVVAAPPCGPVDQDCSRSLTSQVRWPLEMASI